MRETNKHEQGLIYTFIPRNLRKQLYSKHTAGFSPDIDFYSAVVVIHLRLYCNPIGMPKSQVKTKHTAFCSFKNYFLYLQTSTNGKHFSVGIPTT